MSMDSLYAVLDGPHIEGLLPDGRHASSPLVSHIEGNLYMGGCRDGVRLPDDFVYVLSLYPWERYELGPNTLRDELRLYDGSELPDTHMLRAAAARAREMLSRGKVLVHCQAGLNRSGLLSTLVLVGQGHSAEDAIALLRERRDPYVLCNKTFEAWLLAHDAERQAA